MIKSSSINIFLSSLVLLIGSKANVLAISDVFLVFSIVFTTFIFFKRKKIFPKSFKIFTLIYFFLTLIYLYKFGWINVTSSIRVYIKALLGVMIILLLRKDFFIHLEKLIVILASISIPFYILQLIDYELLKSIIGFHENTISFLDYRSDWYVNNVFFTLNDNALFRNSGFTWEPKGFANFLVIATIINLIRNNFTFNKSLLVLSVALLTTLSTVGFVIFFLLLPYFIYQQKNTLNLFKLSFMLIIALSIFRLDFMSEKIINEANTRENNLKYIFVKTQSETVSLGRFGSMALAFLDFPKNPVTGIGMQDSERTQGLHTRLIWVNGLADFLSRFGILGILFLIITYSKSINLILKDFGVNKGKNTILFIFLSIFFASAVIIQPLFFAFQFYYIIDK